MRIWFFCEDRKKNRQPTDPDRIGAKGKEQKKEDNLGGGFQKKNKQTQSYLPQLGGAKSGKQPPAPLSLEGVVEGRRHGNER